MNRLSLLVMMLFAMHLTAKPRIANDLSRHAGFNPSVTLDVFVDSLPPVISCPPNDTVTLPPLRCDTVYNFSVTATDDVGVITIIQINGQPSGANLPIGTVMNSFIAVDAAGNTASCSFSVTVLDSGPLFLDCQTLATVLLDENCTKTLENGLALLEFGLYGCPDQYSVQIDKVPPFGNGPWIPAVFDANDRGKSYAMQVSSTITGNRCTGNIIVKDATAPKLVCPPLTVSCVVSNLDPYFLRDSLGLPFGIPEITDNCTPQNLIILSIADNDTSGVCNSDSVMIIGTKRRTWWASDQSGNQNTCLQIIDRVQRESDLQLPADFVVNDCHAAAPPPSPATSPYIQVGPYRYTPNPVGVMCNYGFGYQDSLDNTMASCPGERIVLRRWEILNWCSGQTRFYTQVITLRDTTTPVLICPDSVHVQSFADACFDTLDLPDVFAYDECSAFISVSVAWEHDSLVQTLSGQLDSLPAAAPNLADTLCRFGVVNDFPVGRRTLTYTATDLCNNVGSCVVQITFSDSLAPQAQCKPYLDVFLDSSGHASLPAASLDNNSADNCNPVFIKTGRIDANTCQDTANYGDFVHFCCTDVSDTIQVRLVVFDLPVPPGNIPRNPLPFNPAACIAQVFVKDTFPPQCTAFPDITISCEDVDSLSQIIGIMNQSCRTDSVVLLDQFNNFNEECWNGNIVKTFTPYSDGIPGIPCMQSITILPEDPGYYIRFPDDAILTVCNQQGIYGEPQLYNLSCENIEITYTDQLFTVVPDACNSIHRTWKIIDSCTYNPALPLISVPNPNPSPITNSPINFPGPIVSAPGTTGVWAPTITSIQPGQPGTNFSTFWSDQGYGYQYVQVLKFLDLQKPVGYCPQDLQWADPTANNDALWNAVYWVDPDNGSNDLPEMPVPELSITFTDACSKNQITARYLLFLDLDGNGTQETVLSSVNLPAYNTVRYNNINSQNYAGGEARAFDFRPVASNQKYGFTLQKTVVGDSLKASVAWNTLAEQNVYIPAQIPYGTHRIQWIITDQCGNNTNCEYAFTIFDSGAPHVECGQNVEVELDQNHVGALNLLDLSYTITLNDPLSDDYLVGIKRAGVGAGFPLNSQGLPPGVLYLGCNDQGETDIEVWVQDGTGLTDSCTITVLVTDADSSCLTPTQTAEITGSVVSETTQPIGNARVLLTIEHPDLMAPVTDTVITGADGLFTFGQTAAFGAQVSVGAIKDINPLNGVSTLDLSTISKHIMGVEMLDSPYKIMAADANRNNFVTGTDIIEFRKLILGIYDELPANSSWRFVDADFNFPLPSNPFLTPVPELVYFDNFNGQQANLIGIKVGDVNGNADPLNLSASDERGGAAICYRLPDQTFVPGDIIQVDFRLPVPALALQGTLGFEGLELMDIMPGPGLTPAHFGVFPQAITVVSESGAADFSLRFRATAAGTLHQALYCSDYITQSGVWRSEDDYRRLGLQFEGGASDGGNLHLHGPSPNPFEDKTYVEFTLTENALVQWRIYDPAGRLILTQSRWMEAGTRTIPVDLSEYTAKGLFLYEINANTALYRGKMLRY